MGYSFRLTARVLLYSPSHKQDSTYHGLWYTSCGALAGTRNSSMGPPHEGSIRRPIAQWANSLPLSYVPLPNWRQIEGDDRATYPSTMFMSTSSSMPRNSVWMMSSPPLSLLLLLKLDLDLDSSLHESPGEKITIK